MVLKNNPVRVALALILLIIPYYGLAAGKQFASLKSDKIFLRVGPSKNYPIKWVYKSKGEPVEIIADFEDWRKVRDFDGEAGWIHFSLLSEAKTGIINSSKSAILYKSSSYDSKKLLKLEPGVRIKIKKCDPEWCQVRIDKLTGWVIKASIWGNTS